MAVPVFRNPDKFQVLPYRDWLRKNQPQGSQGYVVEDLDLLVRGYGPRYGTDAKGRFMECELKFYPRNIGPAQKRTFGLRDEMMRRGDPDGERYLGFYVVQYDNEDWDLSKFWVNGLPMTRDEFHKFIDLDPDMLDSVPACKF